MKKLIIYFVVALFTLSGCNYNKNQEKTTSTKPIKIGMLKLSSSAPLFIGIEKGFFKEQNLDIEPTWFDAAQPIAVATAGGDLDIGATGITASLYNMVANGQKLTIVADKGREAKGYSSNALMVSPKSQINKIEDLKGKKVGITQTGSTYHYMIGRLLELHGLSLKDIELVPLNSVNGMIEAIKNEAIDATLLTEPHVSNAINQGYGKLLVSVGDEMDYQTSAIFLSEKFKEKKDIALRFLKAYVKSTRYYNEAITQKESQKYKEVISIIAKYTKQPEESIKKGLPFIDYNAKVLKDDIETQISWYHKENLIEQQVNVSDILNTDLLDQVINQIGD
ncbi:ABC transporter substrate-binding protein [Bacillus sp. 196mf]|uniref:ABC transporter substrate-binding protein n=1 Tax=Bacillus sp. 196mf TaxID=1761754 RepID=UPI000D7BE10B|nr:ABC transporter substrate-binding protein [Bacillus sp. 196mf]PYE88350.1 NitT/TauT family transport system substrate-binding protein [Bacillus sp. 196mf]